jgi:hypothetical protein
MKAIARENGEELPGELRDFMKVHGPSINILSTGAIMKSDKIWHTTIYYSEEQQLFDWTKAKKKARLRRRACSGFIGCDVYSAAACSLTKPSAMVVRARSVAFSFSRVWVSRSTTSVCPMFWANTLKVP